MDTIKQQKIIDNWNKHRPIGTDVDVQLDNDTIQRTKTRSEAWLLGGHTAVISLDGISGGYMLTRVRPVS